MVLLPPDPFFGQRYIHILGRQKLYHVVKYTGGSAELLFFVEGLRFPDEGFPGLVSIHVSLLEYMSEVRAPGLPRAGLPLGARRGSFQRAKPRIPCPPPLLPSPTMLHSPQGTKGESRLGDLDAPTIHVPVRLGPAYIDQNRLWSQTAQVQAHETPGR